MAAVKSFEELEMWKEARVLCSSIFLLVEKESFRRDIGLRQQMLNSSGSIMDNLAEGFERNGNKEFIQFLFIAKGSLGELRSQIIRSFDRAYLNDNEFQQFNETIKSLGSKIWNMISYLRKTEFKGIKYATPLTTTKPQ